MELLIYMPCNILDILKASGGIIIFLIFGICGGGVVE
jgi:hypothetical protein